MFQELYIEKRHVFQYRLEYKYGFTLNNEHFYEKLPFNKKTRELNFEKISKSIMRIKTKVFNKSIMSFNWNIGNGTIIRYDGIIFPPNECEAKKTVIDKFKSLFKSYSNSEMITKYKFNIYDSVFFHFQRLFERNDLSDIFSIRNALDYMLAGVKRLLIEYSHDYIRYVEKVIYI